MNYFPGSNTSTILANLLANLKQEVSKEKSPINKGTLPILLTLPTSRARTRVLFNSSFFTEFRNRLARLARLDRGNEHKGFLLLTINPEVSKVSWVSGVSHA